MRRGGLSGEGGHRGMMKSKDCYNMLIYMHFHSAALLQRGESVDCR